MTERMYIGGYSNTIKICNFREGELKIINEIDGIINPSFLHVNKDRLYAVSETETGSINAYEIVKNSLKLINAKSINQSLPCYITSNEKRKSLLVASYGAGSILCYDLKKNGSIGEKVALRSYENSHMHFAEFIEDAIYAVDLGRDAVYLYNSEMELISQINTEEKSGPRHLVVGKDKKIYIDTELSNEVLVYKQKENKFELIQKVSTLIDKTVASYAGAIKISQDNRNIYVTNRGHNSITVYAVHKNRLEQIQNISSYGNFPRDIILNENEEYALVANQKSNNITIYKRDPKSGILSKIENADVLVEKPSCIVRSNYEI